jgi:hypothetical protein
MEFSGDAQVWEDLMQLVPDILELVCDAWDRAKGVAPTEIEIAISRRLYPPLWKLKNERDLPFRIHSEFVVHDDVTGEELGRVDFAFIPRGTANESVYLALECKRLRVREARSVRSYADVYVGPEGMMRFISGKYAKGHPAAAMAGYVMDGDSASAMVSVQEAIKKQTAGLCVSAGSELGPCETLCERSNVKESRHEIAGNRFSLYHLFLAVADAPPARNGKPSLN